jgi:hypothetical protein
MRIAVQVVVEWYACVGLAQTGGWAAAGCRIYVGQLRGARVYNHWQPSWAVQHWCLLGGILSSSQLPGEEINKGRLGR